MSVCDKLGVSYGLAHKYFNSKLADIPHHVWEEMRQKEMTKRRRGGDDTEVKQDLKERGME